MRIGQPSLVDPPRVFVTYGSYCTPKNHNFRSNDRFQFKLRSPIHSRTGTAIKMNTNELTATLGFLTDAGHLLAIAAPNTSAHLMARRNDLMLEYDMTLTDKERQHVCASCGHILRLGQGSGLLIKTKPIIHQNKPRRTRGSKSRATARLDSSTTAPSGPCKSISCGRCNSVTEVRLPAPTPISRRKTRGDKATKTMSLAMGASTPSTTASEVAPQKTTSNASSKKRAKSRKAGLQALLTQSSASRGSQTGFGLSLSDFMQK